MEDKSSAWVRNDPAPGVGKDGEGVARWPPKTLFWGNIFCQHVLNVIFILQYDANGCSKWTNVVFCCESPIIEGSKKYYDTR